MSPNGDGRMDTTTVRVTVTGHLSSAGTCKPFFDGIVGAGGPQGSVVGKNVAFTWDGKNACRHGGPGRTVSDHRLDRRRLEQPGIDQQGRDRRPARGGSHARCVARAGSRPTATATRTARGCRWRADERIAGTARLFDKNGTHRPSLDDHRGNRRLVDLERPEHGRDDGRRRPLHAPGAGARPGRQPDRPRHDRPRRPDDPVGDLGAVVVHPARRARRTG